MHVYLDHRQPCHGLDGTLDILLCRKGNLRNADAILDDNVEIDRSLFLTDFNLDPLREILAPQDLGDAAGDTAAHARNSIDLRRGKPCDNADDLIGNARSKLSRKGCDLIVANDVSRPDSTFGSDTDRVAFVWPDRTEQLETLPLDEVARELLDRVRDLAGA